MVKTMRDVPSSHWARRAVSTSLGLTLALSLWACGARVDERVQESNTNWLKACTADQHCGEGLACVCGACTETCEEQACPSRLACVSDTQCTTGATSSCQMTCERSRDCEALAKGMRCQDGVCVDDVGLTFERVSNNLSPDSSGGVRPCSEMFPGVALNDIPSDPFVVLDSSIKGSELSLSVSYSGGCSPHDHALCFALETDTTPANAVLKLIHDAHDDACEQGVLLDLRFDLTPVAETYADATMQRSDFIATTFGVLGYGELSCQQRRAAAALEFATFPLTELSTCERDEECVWASNDTGCYASCGVVASTSAATALRAHIEKIDDNFCATYADDCGPVIVPPCTPGLAPVCVEGRCTEPAR